MNEKIIEQANYFLNEDVNGYDISPDAILNHVQSIHGKSEDWDEGDLSDRIYRYDHYDSLSDIPMNKLNPEEWYIDEDYVDELVDMIKSNGGKYAPVVVGEDPPYSNYTIIDGGHRINALQKMGYTSVHGYIGRLKN